MRTVSKERWSKEKPEEKKKPADDRKPVANGSVSGTERPKKSGGAGIHSSFYFCVKEGKRVF